MADQQREHLRNTVKNLLMGGHAVTYMAVGLSMLIGGKTRMSTPSFETALSWAPYSVWALGPLLGGLLIVFPQARIHGFLIVAVWCAIWGSSFGVNSIVSSSPTPYYPFFIYAGLCLNALVLGMATRKIEQLEREEHARLLLARKRREDSQRGHHQ